MERTARAGRGLVLPAAARIPAWLTALVGRDEAVGVVRRLLADHRLVTLVGAGGAGKTRLAAAVAAVPASAERVAAWVDLTAVSDPSLVALHAMSTLGVREGAGRGAVDAIVAALADHAVLLVLDNCEHVADACAHLAESLLGGCPRMRVLATSRQALGLTGEKVWPVPPLSLPDGDGPAVREAAAVQLFEQRAADVQPDFRVTAANAAAVARICRRLDGLPLAIELVAARVRLMPPEQLVTRLDGVLEIRPTRHPAAQPRHRTLRALIDWSYALLAPSERLLFERLAIFAGGFTLAAAEAVVPGDGLVAGELFDALTALVDRSLVTMRETSGEARYVQLETVRLYALDRLTTGHAPDAVQRLRRRQALHCLSFAEAAAAGLRSRAQIDWLARLDEEHDNLRLALGWSLEAGEPELALRLCVALHDFWRIRGHLTEGRHWLERALRTGAGPDALRARALTGAALIDRHRGEHVSLVELLTEAERLARSSRDRTALADALTHLGIGLRERQDIAAARERLDEALSLWRDAGDPRGLVLALGIRASVALAEGDTRHAHTLRQEALDVATRAGDTDGVARSLIGLGEIARLDGDPASARSYNVRSLALFRELGDPWHVAATLHNLGWIDVGDGRFDDAYRDFSASFDTFGTGENPYGKVLCLIGLARVLHDVGDAPDAAVVLAAATRHAAEITDAGVRPAAPADVASWEHTRSIIEAALDVEHRERAARLGSTMSLYEAYGRACDRLDTLLPDARPVAAEDHEDARVNGNTATRGGDRYAVSDATSRVAVRAPDTDAVAAGGAIERAALTVRALGTLRIHVDGRPLAGDASGAGKPRELLLILLCRPGGATREQIGALFWPESSAAQVKNSFHVTLHRLRRALGHPEWIVIEGDRYRIAPAVAVDFDAARFEEAMTAALASAGRDAGAAERIAAALSLYDSDFLDGEVVGDWHLDVRDRLRRLHESGLLARARILMDAGRFTDAAADMRRVIERDPLHEEACRLLMTCHARAGQPVEAMRVFTTLRERLADELGASPAAATAALFETIRSTGTIADA